MELIDFSLPSLHTALLCIVLNPLYWNVMGRLEYSSGMISALFGGNKRRGCQVLAVTIFLLTTIRTHFFKLAISEQRTFSDECPELQALGIGFLIVGTILVVMSFYKLGFYGTFLGDYFGIYDLPEPVTSFPFNLTNDPMYWGSTINYLGLSCATHSPCGLVLTAMIALGYAVAIHFESAMLQKFFPNFQRTSPSK